MARAELGQRVSYTHVDGWGLRLIGEGIQGTVIATSEHLARVKFDTGEVYAFDRISDPRLKKVH